jgi:hypothetical protein
MAIKLQVELFLFCRCCILMTPNEAAATYRSNFAVKPMKRAEDNPDEIRQMTLTDGMNELPEAQAPVSLFVRHASVPNSFANASEARHLWVIRSEDFPVALEICSWGKTLQSGKIKHSNLTGGSPAHSGGEVWFIDDNKVAVNAASGRYGADSDNEFGQIVDALRHSGYRVASMGFDLDNKSVANRIFAGDPIWQDPL